MSTETDTTQASVEASINGTAREMRQSMGAVKLSFSWLGTRRKLSDAQTTQAANSFDAAADLVSASKKLIDTSHPAYKAATAIKSQAMSYWRGMTLPYPQDGVRLIRQADVESFEIKMREFKDQLAAAAANLQLEYEAIKVAAREKLGQLYNPADYPPTLEGMFTISWEYPPVEPPRYLMNFNPELYEQEQNRVQQRFENAVAMAEEAFAEQLSDMVSHLIERLADNPDGTQKVFRATAIDNFKEFYENFRKMNVRSNPQLESLIAQASNLVGGVSAQELRTDKSLRQNLTAQMSNLQTALNSVIVDAPRRRIMSME
jgi:hypothetical protein